MIRDGIRVVAGVAMFAIGHAAVAQHTTQAAQDKIVRLNQIQVIGSHNSYHAGFAPSERKYLEMKNPAALRGLDYHHAPLADQLSGGVVEAEQISRTALRNCKNKKPGSAIADAGICFMRSRDLPRSALRSRRRREPWLRHVVRP